MRNLITKSFIIAIHLIAFAGVWYSDFYYTNIALTVLAFTVIGLGVTVGFHRYFSHCSFQTSRIFQFILGFWGTLALQGGIIFWCSTHRHHHRNSDKDTDLHSPRHGFWHSHVGWLGNPETTRALEDMTTLKWAQYPELNFLDRYFLLPPLLALAAVSLLGYWHGGMADAARYGVWCYLLPIVITWHATWSINSLTHMVGKRRFETKDDSRNVWFLGILGLGEGWHNNHHRFPTSIRHGMYWYEIDFSYYVILFFKWLGLIWKTQEYPANLKHTSITKAKKGQKKAKNSPIKQAGSSKRNNNNRQNN